MSNRKFSFESVEKFFFKSPSRKEYNIMILAMSTPETPGYKWLSFFKPEYHEEIAPLLGGGPTVRDVVALAYQNRRSEPLINYKLKIVRYDDQQCFDVERESGDEDVWSEVNGYMGVKKILRHIGEFYQNYRFM